MKKGALKLSDSLLNELPSLNRRHASNAIVDKYAYLAKNLTLYEELHDIEIRIKKVNVNDLIGFGFFIKERQNLVNNSVVSYLTLLMAHLKEKGTEIVRKRVVKEFPFNQPEIPSISEDIILALLNTDIATKHKNMLDTLKLIALHGFRYCDLWVLQKEKCVFKTKSGIEYFKYFPPKNRHSKKNKDGVTVPLHPIGKHIIEEWKHLRTYSTWNESRAPKYFKMKDIYPHLKYHPPGVNVGFFSFKDPIVKLPHFYFDESIKKTVFQAVHKQWVLDNQYTAFIVDMTTKERRRVRESDDVGLMAFVPGTKKRLWETLSYHTFRHVYCSRFLAKGGNLLDLRDNVGHSSIEITQKYAHTIESERLERSKNIMDSC